MKGISGRYFCTKIPAVFLFEVTRLTFEQRDVLYYAFK